MEIVDTKAHKKVTHIYTKTHNIHRNRKKTHCSGRKREEKPGVVFESLSEKSLSRGSPKSL